MIFDIDDTFVETHNWTFIPGKDPDDNSVLKVESKVVDGIIEFQPEDAFEFRNLIRRQLSLKKNYVQFKRSKK